LTFLCLSVIIGLWLGRSFEVRVTVAPCYAERGIATASRPSVHL